VLNEGVHFIQKPFSMKDLREKLRETLEAWYGNCATDYAKRAIANSNVLNFFYY
jgi:FixJ family two-component response regulator